MTWDGPSPRQVLAAALWVRSGCTTDVARVLVGASSIEWDGWLERGRDDIGGKRPTIFALLVTKLELADALRRGELLQRLHGYMLRNPERLLDYISRRWPDELRDFALALAPTADSGAPGSLVDHVLDVVARDSTGVAPAGDPREPQPGGPGDGGVVGDEPGEPGAPQR